MISHIKEKVYKELFKKGAEYGPVFENKLAEVFSREN